MVQSAKKNAQDTGAPAGDGEEIDRIMKEIEDLEKKMDSEPEASAEQAGQSEESTSSEEAPTEPFGESSEESKVVSLRPEVGESLAETDAVPAPDEPLIKDHSAFGGEGALALKIGGCAEVSLEFTRAGIAVSLSCTEEGLTISTDQGAEFRIPFKRGA